MNKNVDKGLEAYELDDGAPEVVDIHPARRPPDICDVSEAANSVPGGRLTQADLASNTRDEYAILRLALGAARLSLNHLPVLGAIWRLWAAKRIGDEDPGVSAAEIAEVLEKPLTGLRGILNSMLRNQIIRSVRTNVGWASNRAAYFPTEFGKQVYAMVQFLGPGSSVTIGRTATAWGSKANDEPENFFRHAALLRGSLSNEEGI